MFLIVLMVAAAILIAIKLNSKNPLDSSIGNTKTRATYQKQITIPNVTIPPTKAPTPITQSSMGGVPTQTLLAAAPTTQPSPTEVVVVVAQTTTTSSASATIAPTSTTLVTETETLPSAGSFHPFFILALAASTVIVLSLIF